MLPPLPEPYLSVLQDVLAELLGMKRAVLLAGSAAKGTLHPPTSDIDVLVVDNGPWSINRQMRRGVELHLTSGSQEAWRTVWQRELSGELGANLSLMAGSVILHDPEGTGCTLRDEAIALYTAGPRLTAGSTEVRRRGLTTLADDLQAADRASQPYICCLFVSAVVSSAFVLNGRWRPRHKDAMRLLAEEYPSLAAAVTRALRSHDRETYSKLIWETGQLLKPHGGWLRNDDRTPA